MFPFILRYSGIIAIIIATIALVIPAHQYGINNKKQTITDSMVSKKFRYIITTGLLIGAFFQTLFLVYILLKFRIDFVSIGPLLYLSTTSSTVIVAFFQELKHKILHRVFTYYYFIVQPIAILYISHQIGNILPYFVIIHYLFVAIYYASLVYLLVKYKRENALQEQTAFGLLAFWTIVITLM